VGDVGKDVRAVPEQESIVLASFKNRHAAERMLASLGRNFRREARKGKSDVFVISANADGSLKPTESRAVEASGVVSFLIHIAASVARRGRLRGSNSWVALRLGILYTLKNGLIPRAEVYASPVEALEAAGLSE
jgi:hypothetical protein